MRRAFIRTALPALLLLTPLRTAAGVAAPDAAAQPCPAVIKNAITLEMLMSDRFVPWEAVDAVDAVNAVDAADTVNVIDAVRAADTVKAVADADASGQAAAPDTVGRPLELRADAGQPGDDGKEAGGKPSWIKKNMKFGRRAAFNNSHVTNILIRIYTHDGESFSYAEYRNQAVFGIGFEAAGIIGLILSDAAALNFSPGVVFRKPVNTAVVGTSEIGASFPLLLEWGPFGALRPRGGASGRDDFAGFRAGGFDLRQLRLFGGVWAGAPLFARVKWNGEKSAPFTDRAAADFGLVCGAGIYISDRAFIDARGTFGLSGYDGMPGRRLNQAAIGVNYVK